VRHVPWGHPTPRSLDVPPSRIASGCLDATLATPRFPATAPSHRRPEIPERSTGRSLKRPRRRGEPALRSVQRREGARTAKPGHVALSPGAEPGEGKEAVLETAAFDGQPRGDLSGVERATPFPRRQRLMSATTTCPSSGCTPSTPTRWRAGGTAAGRCRRC